MFVDTFRRMINNASLLCLCLLIWNGVFGVDPDVKSVSVTEGDSVSLNTDVTEIQRNDLILWMFGPQETRIAEIYKLNIDMYDSNERFRDRLQMDSQTGSLTIRNITTEHTGLYKLQIISNTGTSYKRFSLTVYAHLPIPVITRHSSQCSSSSLGSSSLNCSLLCSVSDVSHVTLSWYKGNSLLSNISVSDLSISLSLPLEVEYQDTNTYSCVINNPISHQTKHLNITRLCLSCDEPEERSRLIMAVTLPLLGLISVLVLCLMFRRKHKRSRTKEKTYGEILYAETNFSPHQSQRTDVDTEACTVYSSVKS